MMTDDTIVYSHENEINYQLQLSMFDYLSKRVSSKLDSEIPNLIIFLSYFKEPGKSKNNHSIT